MGVISDTDVGGCGRWVQVMECVKGGCGKGGCEEEG